jgi:hypothetical protein
LQRLCLCQRQSAATQRLLRPRAAVRSDHKAWRRHLQVLLLLLLLLLLELLLLELMLLMELKLVLKRLRLLDHLL